MSKKITLVEAMAFSVAIPFLDSVFNSCVQSGSNMKKANPNFHKRSYLISASKSETLYPVSGFDLLAKGRGKRGCTCKFFARRGVLRIHLKRAKQTLFRRQRSMETLVETAATRPF